MDMRVRLIDGVAPAGQVRALDLARISAALHEISIRFGRERASQTRPGRSTRSVEELCEVRLTWLGGNGTTLDFAVGPADALPLELAELAWQTPAFDRLFAGMVSDRRPDDVSDLVADSVADLVTALNVACTQVEVTVDERPRRRAATSSMRRDTWSTPRRRISDDLTTFVGLLERVDLHTGAFRVRDRCGQVVELDGVRGVEKAAKQIGEQVQAMGIAVHDRSGQLSGLTEVTIEPRNPLLGVGGEPEESSPEEH